MDGGPLAGPALGAPTFALRARALACLLGGSAARSDYLVA